MRARALRRSRFERRPARPRQPHGRASTTDAPQRTLDELLVRRRRTRVVTSGSDVRARAAGLRARSHSVSFASAVTRIRAGVDRRGRPGLHPLRRRAVPVRGLAAADVWSMGATISRRVRRYFVTTFGCQMNAHDSERIKGMLEALGLGEAPSQEEADVLVFNTCTIREKPDKKFAALHRRGGAR